MIQNPFLLKGYGNPGLFCDREVETKRLIDNAKNGVNTTLLSLRRMGKTGLIHHVFHFLERNKSWKSIYVDIYATQNLADFTNRLATAILETFPQTNSIGKKFMNLITGFRPTISYDALTGMPEISFQYGQPKQYQQSLEGLFQFLGQQDKEIFIAIDEFQQIAHFPEKGVEAFLRTTIQSLKNVHFIFSGSHQHLLTEMFNKANRPFFSSTQSLFLKEIPFEKYEGFIQKKFAENKKKIDHSSIEFLLNWTRVHTYYTQVLCNRIFAQINKTVSVDQVYSICDQLLKEQEVVFFQYRNLLTASQWNLLRAIAKEEKVYHPTSGKFIQSHGLGTPSTVKRSLNSLMEKEMIYKKLSDQESYYQVYDCFLSRWLERI